MSSDNWKSLVKEYGPHIGKYYVDKSGEEYYFDGLLHGVDDYYYMMWSGKTQSYTISSCVGSLKQCGFTLRKKKLK